MILTSSREYGCLDGNICEMSWTQEDPAYGAVKIKRTYDYIYDKLPTEKIRLT